jgi:Flp pilus assembly protein CpaB
LSAFAANPGLQRIVRTADRSDRGALARLWFHTAGHGRGVTGGEIKVGNAQATVVGRTRRELTSRVSTGHVVMVLAGALGVLLTLTVLRSADDTRPVLVAAHDLAPGTVLDDASFRVAHVHAENAILSTLYPSDELGALRGHVVTSVVHEGELVAHTAVGERDGKSSARTMSFPIPRSRAVAGKLATGDRVDVLAVDHDSGRADYVLTGAEVVAAESRSSGALSGASDDITVTLVVDPATAPALAAALDGGTVMLVRSTGAPPMPGPPPAPASGGTR